MPSENDLYIDARMTIPETELSFQRSRSSGPGGQNVQKTNSRVQLRFAIATSQAIPEDVRRRFLAHFGSRITESGEIIIASQESRDALRNEQICRERLAELLRSVSKPPVRRKKTKPTRGSIERRLDDKKVRSDRKKQRRDPEY